MASGGPGLDKSSYPIRFTTHAYSGICNLNMDRLVMVFNVFPIFLGEPEVNIYVGFKNGIRFILQNTLRGGIHTFFTHYPVLFVHQDTNVH